MTKINRYGKEYEEYVNKFLKGKIVGSKEETHDIETKTTLYEVKGARIIHVNQSGTSSIGRYKIMLKNHFGLQQIAKTRKKLYKYIFVLQLGNRRMFKSLLWHTVNNLMEDSGKMTKRKGIAWCSLSVKEVW